MTTAKGLRQFLDAEQQRDWPEGEPLPPDAAEREESLEQRFKYTARFEKLLRRPQADEALDILRLYGETCLPIPRSNRALVVVGVLPARAPTRRLLAGQCQLDGAVRPATL